MKKIIWIDVGTHFAQEYNSVFGSNFNFYTQIALRFISGNILGRGKALEFKNIKKIISARKYIRKRKKEFYTIFIEANSKITYNKNIYRNADMVLNLALTDDNYTSLSIIKLYLGSGGDLSQSSSVFSQKHIGFEDKFIPALSISADNCFKMLERYLSEKFKDYVVLLRLNCEGVEDNVIYSAHSYFGKKLQLICGALKDVGELKGLETLDKLEEFIDVNEIVFTKFASPIDTWAEGQKAIQNLLKQINSISNFKIK